MDASRFQATIGGQAMEADVTFDMVAIDLGKLSFHLHGVSSDGVVLSRKVSRAKLFAVVTELAPAIIAMEACPSAHYWGRRFQEAGRHVRLIHPRFVKPFVRGAKNDAIDAEAIFEAASRPTMRFVPVKTIVQQDLQAVHRIRDRLICQRTALINQVRGLLAEYGIILAKGGRRQWRTQDCLISRVRCLSTSSISCAILSVASVPWIRASWRSAEKTRQADAWLPYQASALSSRQRSSPVLMTGDIFAVDASLPLGSGSCRASIRPGESPSLAGSASKPTTICVAR
jgi:hypothetical protein